VTGLDPRYVLTPDDLPKVVEADGTIWPIWLEATHAARLFGVSSDQIRMWAATEDFPLYKIGRRLFVQVGEMNDWIAARAVTGGEIRRAIRREAAERMRMCEPCAEAYIAGHHIVRECLCPCHREENYARPYKDTPEAERLRQASEDAA
jgi:hypothetical protein